MPCSCRGIHSCTCRGHTLTILPPQIFESFTHHTWTWIQPKKTQKIKQNVGAPVWQWDLVSQIPDESLPDSTVNCPCLTLRSFSPKKQRGLLPSPPSTQWDSTIHLPQTEEFQRTQLWVTIEAGRFNGSGNCTWNPWRWSIAAIQIVLSGLFSFSEHKNQAQGASDFSPVCSLKPLFICTSQESWLTAPCRNLPIGRFPPDSSSLEAVLL